MSCLPQPRLLLPPVIIEHTSRFQIRQRNVFYLHISPYLGLVSGNAPMLQCAPDANRAQGFANRPKRGILSGHRATRLALRGVVVHLPLVLHMLHKVHLPGYTCCSKCLANDVRICAQGLVSLHLGSRKESSNDSKTSCHHCISSKSLVSREFYEIFTL